MNAENLAENLRKPVVVVRFVVMGGATTQYFSPALHISAGIRWESTSWILTSQKTAGIHDPGPRITPASDPDPGMIPRLAQPLLPGCSAEAELVSLCLQWSSAMVASQPASRSVCWHCVQSCVRWSAVRWLAESLLTMCCSSALHLLHSMYQVQS